MRQLRGSTSLAHPFRAPSWQGPPAEQPGKAKTVGWRLRLQALLQLPRVPPARHPLASGAATCREIPRPSSTGHLLHALSPGPAAGRQGSVVKPGPGNFTRGNSRGALRRRRLSGVGRVEAAAAARRRRRLRRKRRRQRRRGPVRGEPRGGDGRAAGDRAGGWARRTGTAG